TGNIAATYYYDAFGNILEQTGAVNNSITYAGYQYDEETGLYYLNARMYDPKIARFLQEDTYRGDINDPLSLNYYVYCANNPLVYYDPTGHFGEGIANWWNNTKEGWRTLTNKEEREESMRLIAQYGKGKGKNSALLFGSVFGTGSDLLQDPEETFSTYNREVAKPFITNTLGIKENSTEYKALKYIGTRTETGIGVAANLGKGLVQGSYFLGESIGTCLRPYVIEGGRSLGLFGLDDDAVYNVVFRPR
ncbi:MAG: RHS repeat-associated core domain-containing protein, partial [Desulfitobacteriaceae bacterium]|nr:RHS repeat-associated core domain-containing protein [Desulfitobacteriaceae bacterium]